MTGHRQSARAGVPTRPRCVSRHRRAAVNRPRSRVWRSERDAPRLSAPRCLPGIDRRTPTIRLPLASGPAPQAGFERMSPIPSDDPACKPRPQRARQREQGGVVDTATVSGASAAATTTVINTDELSSSSICETGRVCVRAQSDGAQHRGITPRPSAERLRGILPGQRPAATLVQETQSAAAVGENGLSAFC